MMTELKLPFILKLTCVLLSFVLIVVIMMVGHNVLIPLFFALLCSFVLLPLVNWLERRKVPKAIAVLISVLLLVALFSTFIYMFSLQVLSFANDFNAIQKQIEQTLAEFQQWIYHNYNINTSKQMAYVDGASGSIIGIAGNFAQGILFSVTGALFCIIFIFIYTYFILFYRQLLKQFITGIFPQRHRMQVVAVVKESRIVIYKYILGLAIEMIVVAILNCTALSIAGVPYYMILGLTAALFNVIPYLGFFVSVCIAFLVTISNGTLGLAVETVIIMWIIHFLDANILMPRIVGSRVKMNALITIVAVLSGNLIWGIPGMFLFIPLVAMCKLFFERVSELRPWAILIGDGKNNTKPGKDTTS